ncbi:uncharacterized protein LOC128883414 isoform X2 [Hylaeus volcanicus]|uniref:uncharacterized protein LOC128883414 isoform X2 n=1 Tax=Hylaeus volcanicus TaxID=313075 RepID=UPI0023B825DA|nr:uncharacterized protein LOC128883414 isoform X2 [Hylaeus volcanicus]
MQCCLIADGFSLKNKFFNNTDSQRNTFLSSLTNHIMSFLQQISDPMRVTHTNETSRYLVQVVNTHSLSSPAAQLSVFQIDSAAPDRVSTEIVWECQLPLKHVVTHLAILNTKGSLQKKDTDEIIDMDHFDRFKNLRQSSDEKQIVQMPRELSNMPSPLVFSTALEDNQQEKYTTSLYPSVDHESDETKEVKGHDTVPWLVVLVSTIVDDSEKCHTITTDSPSYLSAFGIATGLTYLKTIPLKYGLVSEILLSSNLRQCFQPNIAALTNDIKTNNLFGLLTYSGQLYLIENISVDPQTALKDPFEKTCTTTRFQQKCLHLHALVSHHQIGVKYVKLFQTPSKSIRVCVFFSNGVAYCYDEYNIAHRLDTLDFPPSDASCALQRSPFTPSDLSISLVKDTTIACFDSVALLQEESWRHHLLHKQRETEDPFKTSPISLANILVNCLQKSCLMESLGITDTSFSLQHLPLEHLCSTNTTTTQDVSESPALQTAKLLTCFTLDHLCHQVTTSTLLASKEEYLYWMMLLCIYCAINEKEKILYTLFNSCLTSMYEECKKTFCKETFHEIRNPLKFHPSFHPVNSNQDSLSYCEDSSTWSTLSSCPMQECSSHTRQAEKDSYETFIFVYWMDLKILYDMNLSPACLFFDYIIKTLLPSSAWKHFTLDDKHRVLFPFYSPPTSQDAYTSQVHIEETKRFDPFYHVIRNVLKKNDQAAIPALVTENQLQTLIHLFETMKQKINKLQIPTTCSRNL